MKTRSLDIVLVAEYNRKNLLKLLRKVEDLGIKIGPGRQIIIRQVDWPETQTARRSQIFPYPTNCPVECSRIGNLFELCTFIIRNPGFVCQSGSIEAYDESLEQFYRETGSDLTVPVFGIYNYRTTLYLKSQERPSEAFKLAAND